MCRAVMKPSCVDWWTDCNEWISCRRHMKARAGSHYQGQLRTLWLGLRNKRAVAAVPISWWRYRAEKGNSTLGGFALHLTTTYATKWANRWLKNAAWLALAFCQFCDTLECRSSHSGHFAVLPS